MGGANGVKKLSGKRSPIKGNYNFYQKRMFFYEGNLGKGDEIEKKSSLVSNTREENDRKEESTGGGEVVGKGGMTDWAGNKKGMAPGQRLVERGRGVLG